MRFQSQALASAWIWLSLDPFLEETMRSAREHTTSTRIHHTWTSDINQNPPSSELCVFLSSSEPSEFFCLSILCPHVFLLLLSFFSILFVCFLTSTPKYSTFSVTPTPSSLHKIRILYSGKLFHAMSLLIPSLPPSDRDTFNLSCGLTF